MIEFLDIQVKDVVAYEIKGKVTADEMKAVLERFETQMEKGRPVHVYQEVSELSLAELEAMKAKFRFFLEHGMSHFGRIAVVADKKWIPKLVNFESRLFKRLEMKGFGLEKKEEAIAFLAQG